MTKNYYEVLGIAPGAGKDEIKRAYFRLVRQYTPESDPERFQEIREAYENLKDGAAREDFLMEVPSDQRGVDVLHAIEQAIDSHQYLTARQLSEDALSDFGDCECFLYYCGLLQRLTGQTGKSVKSFETLRKRYPDKLQYHRELALSYWKRGFTKKAYDAFGQAYEMGERDLDFSQEYAKCCLIRNEYDRSFDLLAESLDAAMQDCVKNQEDLLDLFIGICTAGRFVWKSEQHLQRRKKVLVALRDYLGRFPGQVQKNADILTKTMFMYALEVNRKDAEELALYRLAEDQFLAASGHDAQEKWKQEAFQAEIVALREPENSLPDCLMCVGEAYDKQAEGAPFARLETQLLTLEEWPAIRETIEEFGQMYPFVYAKMTPFLRELSTAYEEDKVPELREKLQRRYDRMELSYSGGQYYTKYPERRRKPKNSFWDSDRQGTYVRSGKKIGRNEPCPCGSGKKYKNCCGRNV